MKKEMIPKMYYKFIQLDKHNKYQVKRYENINI